MPARAARVSAEYCILMVVKRIYMYVLVLLFGVVEIRERMTGPAFQKNSRQIK
jgi:hypothetical protein